jgi:hypothetical protein
MLIYFGVSWWFLHNLLNYIAAFVFCSLFLVFVKVCIVLACWALMYLILYIFRELVLYIQIYL